MYNHKELIGYFELLSMNRKSLSKALVVGAAFFGIANLWPVFNTFVPIYMAELGLNAALIGFIMTWDDYFNMIFGPIAGSLSDRTSTQIGRRKPWILVGAPLGAIFFVVIPLMGSVGGVVLAILLMNISMALFRSPTTALLGDLFTPPQRSTANGIINLIRGLGLIVALIAGGILYQYNRTAPFLFGGLVMVITLLIVLTKLREPTVRHQKVTKSPFWAQITAPARFVKGNKAGLMVLLASLFLYIGFSSVQIWLSSFGKFSLGIDPGRMALISAIFVLMFVIFSVPSGLIATRIGRRPTILLGVVALTVSFGIGCTVHNEVMLIGILIPAGIAWALININNLPFLYDASSVERIGALTGLYLFVTNLATIIGPQSIGFLVDLSGKDYRVIFLFAACFIAIGGLLVALTRETQRHTQIV
ncbi:MAG: MFS transporter [Anaerolineales bacterium]|jgi:MFS family permease